MGNCLNKASKKQHQEARRRRGERVVPEDREENQAVIRSVGDMLLHEEEGEEAPAPSTAAAGMKVKVVLTRAELEWLMAQLKSGEQRLEDVLRQVGTARTGAGNEDSKPQTRADGWRPRLERIIECPLEAAVEAT